MSTTDEVKRKFIVQGQCWLTGDWKNLARCSTLEQAHPMVGAYKAGMHWKDVRVFDKQNGVAV